MATFVLLNAHLTVNSVNLSDHVLSLTVNYGADLPEETAMGDLTRTRLPGLIDWSVEVNFKQDFAANEVDRTLFPLVGAPAFPIIIRADAGARSATNPQYNGNALLESYPILTNSVGELAQSSVTFQADGTLTRSTS